MTSISSAATYYIRPGATGLNNGLDWKNAFNTIPDKLQRGATYYLADGEYTSLLTLDDPEDKNLFISIKKATPIEHGTDVGWYDEYGVGQAILGRITFKTGYYIIDGTKGGGPNTWDQGHGIWIKGVSDNYDYLIYFRYRGITNIHFKHVAFGNDSWPSPGCDVAVYTAVGGKDVKFSYCYFFNLGDVGFTLLDVENWTWEYCRFDRIDRYGEKTVCGTGINHGAGWELSGSFTHNVTIRYSYITNIEGTGWIGIYGDGNVDGLYIYGNIFENTTGFKGTWGNGVIYNVSGTVGVLHNIKIYNNTFLNLNSPAIIGLSKDINGTIANLQSSGNEFVNNIIWNIPSPPIMNGAAMRFNNASEYSFSGDENLILLHSSPFRSGANLATEIGPGKPLLSPFNFDMYGTQRGSDGNWTIGAIEFRMNDTPPGNPPNLRLE